MRRIITPTAELSSSAGRRLAEMIAPPVPTLLLLSGGSALSMLEHVGDDALGEHLFISMLDERVGPREESNSARLLATGFASRARARGASLFDPEPDHGTPEEVAARLAGFHTTFTGANKDGRTVATLGVGEDSHVAGILPFTNDENVFDALFLDDAPFYRGYDAGEGYLFRHRATATFPLILSLRSGIVFVSGEQKREGLSAALLGAPLRAAPAAILRSLPTVELYTDIEGLPVVE